MNLHTSQIREKLPTLTAGDSILLSGTIYTARDAAHARINALLDEGKPPPFELDGACIYYAGPTPAPKVNPGGIVVGSCGPTTSRRMDSFTPRLISLGVVCTIGKGGRSDEVTQAMRQFGAVYLTAIGGAGALYSRGIKSVEVIAFPELGCESVKRFQIENFRLFVAIDSRGGSMYKK
ncbi:fumarate hydratase [Clostridia bacterium]|nr:fumarate hydratase [Clostridia bacterium]